MPARVLQALTLFRHDPRNRTVEDIAQELGVSVSSAYRDVQELCRVGFLDPVAGAGYALGPAFIEYDRLTRQGDALVQSAVAPMKALVAAPNERGVAILCRRYRDMVMCVHQERGAAAEINPSYERGVAMPLFVGASSRIILAYLDDRSLKRIYLGNEENGRGQNPVTNWKAFKADLRAIRQDGYVLSRAEIAKQRVAVAAPIFANGQIVAGLSLVAEEAACPDWAERHGAVTQAAAQVTAKIGSLDVQASR